MKLNKGSVELPDGCREPLYLIPKNLTLHEYVTNMHPLR